MYLYFYLAQATVLWLLMLLGLINLLWPSAPVNNRAVVVLPLWFSLSGSTTISCSSYDSGGVVVVLVPLALVDGSAPSTTITVALGRDGAAAAKEDWWDLTEALGGGFEELVLDAAAATGGSMTDKVARVLAAMAAGGGAAVTIGPPLTTGMAMAFVACVVAIAVAEVDAVTGATAMATLVVFVVAATSAVTVPPVGDVLIATVG